MLVLVLYNTLKSIKQEDTEKILTFSSELKKFLEIERHF